MKLQTHYETRQALGTDIHIMLVTDRGTDWALGVLRGFWLEIFRFEKRCSRFIQSSELSLFNRQAGTRQPVTPEFREVLLAARRMGDETAGVYNPFVLPALQRAGYKQSLVPGFADDAVDDHSGRSIAPVAALTIGDDWAEIPYGTAIDLGGCGKGFIGDVLAAQARQLADIRGFWFSIGGDTVTGGFDEQGKAWTVYITPHISQLAERDRLGRAIAPDGGVMAVATSTVRFRSGKQQTAGMKTSKRWHHIIDPRTGEPADSTVRLASVSGNSLLQADVLASCAIIVGAAAAPKLCVGEVTGLLIQDDKDVIRTIGKGIQRV